MPTVFLPTPLRKFAEGKTRIQVKGDTVEVVISELIESYPEIKKHLLDGSGQIRSFVNIFVDNDDIRDLQRENTTVKESTVISIIPAIAGGSN
jgi:molybdopterin converting factor small subunit